MQTVSFPQAVFRRPSMYTMGGSFEEVVAFLDGFYSGMAKCPGPGRDRAVWTPFKFWLADRLDVEMSRVIMTFRENPPPDRSLCEAMFDLLGEFQELNPSLDL